MLNQEIRLSAMTAEDLRFGRHALEYALQGWGCGQLPDALLVFSELATNAIVHAGGAPQISITRGESTVRIEVHDTVHDIPQRRPAPGPASGGFGLNIVSTVSDEWGWTQTASGKVVWSNVPC